jgi:hypothetical protein
MYVSERPNHLFHIMARAGRSKGDLLDHYPHGGLVDALLVLVLNPGSGYDKE